MNWTDHRLEMNQSVALPIDWQQHNWLRAGFSLRQAGNIDYRFGEAADVQASRDKVSQALGSKVDDWVVMQQIHNTNVEVVGESDRGRGAHDFSSGFPQTDGLRTSTPGLLLTVMVADCVPLLIIDPKQKLVGVFHAGWKGTVADMAAAAVRMFVDSNPSDLEALIGPSIGPECYEVDAKVMEPAVKFLEADQVGREQAAELRRTRHFDLWSANELGLRRAGVKKIIRTDLCTKCNDEFFFSYRGEKRQSGEFAGLIGIA